MRRVSSDARIARVRETLALRDAVLGVFAAPAGVPLDDGDVARLRAAPVESWRLLLKAECCALPLAARLRASGVITSLPAPSQGAITEAQLAETQRVMAARSQLRELDVVASALRIEVVVLKGGAIAADASKQPIDLGDVDLLLTPDAAARMWRRLLEDGWRMKSADGIAATDEVALEFNHFNPLLPPRDGIPVELHQRVQYGRATAHAIATRPLAGYQALHRAIGESSVVLALEHSVIHHPHRRGHLRDLVLIADAIAECTPEIRERLDPSRGDPRYAIELRDMLDQVLAIGRGERPTDSPSIRLAVARKYLVVLGDDRRLSARVPGWWDLSHVALERGSLRRTRYAQMARAGLGPIPPGSTFRAGALAARAPRLANAAMRVIRAGYWVAVTALSIALGPRLRRRVNAAIEPIR